ncbi:MAG: four helix bundle protein [Candidatus Wildermuthbacteria bacterium]|nr:four helix bundle protein [Candidatus Wildermuthbacteria bacterium]
MSELNVHKKSFQVSPPPRLLPLLQKLKEAYLAWYGYYQILPKLHRHSLGQRIDTLFVEIIEAVAMASFLSPQQKHPYVRLSIRKLDTLKILLMVLWETKSVDDKKYIAVSIKINEIGRMLGGWNGQLQKQNSPDKREK